MEDVPLPEWVTPAEGAFLLDVPEHLIRQGVRDGRLSSFRVRTPRREPDIVLVRTSELVAAAGSAIAATPVTRAGHPPSTRWRLPAAVSMLVVVVGALVGLTWSSARRPDPPSERFVPATGLPGVSGHSPGGSDTDSGTPLTGMPVIVGEVHHLQDGRWAASAVSITNPNEDLWLPDSEVLFLALDGAGRIIGRWQALVSLGPGQARTVVAQAIDLGSAEATLDHVQAVLSPAPWQPSSSFRPVDLELSRLRVVAGPQDVKVTGEISNGGSEEVYAEVFCALWDRRGGFAGAGLVYVEPEGGDQLSFVMPVDHHAPGATSADCYAGVQ